MIAVVSYLYHHSYLSAKQDGPLVRAALHYLSSHSYLRALPPANWRMEAWSSSGDSSAESGGWWTEDRVKRFKELMNVHEEVSFVVAMNACVNSLPYGCSKHT